MRKLLTLMMVFILSIGIMACAEEKVTLQSTTVNGLTLDVPSDFGAFEDVEGQIKMSKNENSTSVIAISERVDAQGLTADSLDQQTFVENVLSSFEDLQVLEFSNAKTIAGVPSVFAHYSGKNTSNVEVEGYTYLLYHDDSTFQSIAFNFTKGADSSLTQNITTIIDSMK